MISIKGSSGGGEIEVVNGIVEKFKAYEDDISPNTFIKFVNRLNEANHQNIAAMYYACSADAVILDDKRLFLACSAGNSSANRLKLYAAVLTIENGAITTGTRVLISEIVGYRGLEVVKLSSGKIYIQAINNSESSTGYSMCTVSGSEISSTEMVWGIQDYYSCNPMCAAVEVSSNKIVSAFPDTGDSSTAQYTGKPHARILNVASNGEITKGSQLLIDSNEPPYSGNNAELIKISSTKVLLLYGIVKGVVLSISGDTITKGTILTIDREYMYGGKEGSCLLDNGKIAVAVNKNLYILSVSGNTITIEKTYELPDKMNSTDSRKTVTQISTEHLLVANVDLYSSKTMQGCLISISSGKVYGGVVEIVGTTSDLAQQAFLALKLKEDGVFMLETGARKAGPNTQIINDAEVKIDIASDAIEGVATDKATKSMSGKAWYLK